MDKGPFAQHRALFILSYSRICKLIEVIYYFGRQLNLVMISDTEGTNCFTAHVIFHALWEIMPLNFYWYWLLLVSFCPTGLMWLDSPHIWYQSVMLSALCPLPGVSVVGTISWWESTLLWLSTAVVCANYSCGKNVFLNMQCVWFSYNGLVTNSRWQLYPE